MGVYIELPKEWAKWSFDVRDIHDNELEAKVTDLDLVRCGECEYYEESEYIEGDMVCKYHIRHTYYTEADRYCYYGERNSKDNSNQI